MESDGARASRRCSFPGRSRRGRSATTTGLREGRLCFLLGLVECLLDRLLTAEGTRDGTAPGSVDLGAGSGRVQRHGGVQGRVQVVDRSLEARVRHVLEVLRL